MRRRFVAFVNPATRGDHARVMNLLHTQAPPEVAVDIRRLSPDGVAAALAHTPITAFDAAIAVGGDGTVGAVATAVRGTGVPLGIIPTGATNVIASDLRIPGNPGAATRLLFSSRRTLVLDIGAAGADSGFLHMAGAGLDSRMFAATNAPLKQRLAWLAYVPAAVHSLRRARYRFTLVVDGCRLEAHSPWVLVANGGSLSRRLTLDRSIRANDGWLDLLVFLPDGPCSVASILSHLARQQVAQSPHVLHRRARQITIAADPVLPVQMDGDLRTSTPVTFTVSPGAVRAIVGDA